MLCVATIIVKNKKLNFKSNRWIYRNLITITCHRSTWINWKFSFRFKKLIMKYAKKFKLVPYTNETPAASQIVSTFNNALTTDKYPDEKVKIYNQALSKIKDLNTANISAIESKNYEEDDEISGESAKARKDRIAKEIDKLEKYTNAYNASKTVQDYSNSDFLKTKKFKEKSKFDNEKFMTLLDDLVKNNITVTTRLQDIYNLINAKVPQLSNTNTYDWEYTQSKKNPNNPRIKQVNNETTVKTENANSESENLETVFNEESDEEPNNAESDVTFLKAKKINNTINPLNTESLGNTARKA